jgi:hypothetical protein
MSMNANYNNKTALQALLDKIRKSYYEISRQKKRAPVQNRKSPNVTHNPNKRSSNIN